MKPRLILASLAALLVQTPIIARADVKHVIIISVDGLHQADLTDPALQGRIPSLLALAKTGVWYSNATGTAPADSFPGTLAYLTGAGPATTGVYYDDSYSRILIAPGKPLSTIPGTPVQNTEVIDKNFDLIDGGGNSGMDSIDVAKLPLDPARGGAPVFPHDYLKVNTIFEIAHAAGLRTSMSDKHPAYEIANGPSGKGIDDLYCPEIQAKGAIVDGKLVDFSTAPAGTKFKGINKDVTLACAYDDLKIAAVLRQIHGQDARGTSQPGMPALIAVNIQALNIAEKDMTGGIDLVDGKEVPSKILVQALEHTDGLLSSICTELKSAGVWDQTLIVLTAKHGQDPRVGSGKTIDPSVLVNPLKAAGIDLAASTLDDVALLWLKDSTQSVKAASILSSLQAGGNSAGIQQVLSGDQLQAAHLAGPADRTPDIFLTMIPGSIITDKAKRSEHGGFCDDDTRVPLVLFGGAVDEKHRGTEITEPVKTTQIAVTVLQSLGLDSRLLQGAQIEKTQPLPQSGFELVAQAK